MRCPRYKTLTAEQAVERGWCKVCKEACIKFDPVDFAEFAGAHGVDAVIIRIEGATYFRLAAMPKGAFLKLLREYIKTKVGVR